MSSLILIVAARIMLPLLLFYSIFLLLRGHQLPGGGFSGGLVAAGAYSAYALAYGCSAARAVLRVAPHTLIASGLAILLLCAIAPLIFGFSVLSGHWLVVQLPTGSLHLGTPILFDGGVYLIVVGGALQIMFTILQE